MRREGFELRISRPQVLVPTNRWRPPRAYREATIDVETNTLAPVIEKDTGVRKRRALVRG